jgi:hypothetical protein
MASATWRLANSAAAPASRSTRRISSVAYALELMASELKMARAFFFGEPLVDFLFVCERRADQDSSQGRPESAAAGPRLACFRAGAEDSRAHMPEVRRRRALDFDSPVAQLPARTGLSETAHRNGRSAPTRPVDPLPGRRPGGLVLTMRVDAFALTTVASAMLVLSSRHPAV